MTGTALTSAEELDKVYGLDVVVIPTNKDMVRQDFADKVFKTEEGKFKAAVKEIEELNESIVRLETVAEVKDGFLKQCKHK